MRNPPNYGSVIDLGKNRRKPLAVRVPVGKKITEDKREIIQYKYIGYFEKTKEGRKEALQLLANYNAGKYIVEYTTKGIPTFKELSEKWKETYLSRLEHRKGKPSPSMEKQLRISIEKCKPIHDMYIDRIHFQDVQAIADANKDLSHSTVSRIKMVLQGTFELAKKQKFITDNFIEDIEFLEALPKESIHKDFSEEEIKKLWNLQKNDDDIKIILLLIYTGLRISELFDLKTENVHLKERYMIGGMKTKAGTDRVIPIHKKIVPIVEYFMTNNKYLYPNKKGTKWSYARFHEDMFMSTMVRLGMSHRIHDTRYTTATLLDRANVNPNVIKDILGHAREGFTNKVYVQKNIQDLIEGIDMID